MEIIFSHQATKDLKYWKKSGNKIIQKRIEDLIFAIIENPTEGIGKPEPLKYKLFGSWSRRIDSEHRIVYSIIDGNLEIETLKGHY